MPRKPSAKSLAKAVITGNLTLERAMEEHLHENYRGSLEIPADADVQLAICYANMGWKDRVLDLSGEAMSVADIIKEFDLESFLPLLNQQEEACFRMGELVTWYDSTYRVIGRRAVSQSVDHRFDDWEVFLEGVDGGIAGFYSESDVERFEEKEAVGPDDLSAGSTEDPGQ